MSAIELLDAHKKSISRDTWKLIEICKKIQIADSVLNIFSSKTCSHLPSSQKPPDNRSQVLAGWRKRCQFIYLQLFVVIGMIDLIET